MFQRAQHRRQAIPQTPKYELAMGLVGQQVSAKEKCATWADESSLDVASQDLRTTKIWLAKAQRLSSYCAGNVFNQLVLQGGQHSGGVLPRDQNSLRTETTGTTWPLDFKCPGILVSLKLMIEILVQCKFFQISKFLLCRAQNTDG